MSTRSIIALLLPAMAGMLQSCFKDEPLNVECDIEEAYVSLADPAATFFNASDTLVRVSSDQTSIVFNVRSSADLTQMAPEFVLTPGATVTPPSGSAHDFSDGPIDYTVKSEDGKWSRTYTVSFKRNVRSTNTEIDYTFDHYYLNSTGKYYCWTDFDAQGDSLFNWATANPGYQLARGTAKPMDYPTVPAEGINGGMAVKLETRSTGTFGAMVGRRLAAGNIFIGTFDMGKALTETMKATRFGLPFAMKPLTLSGYFKFIPGEVYTDASGNVVEGKHDTATIYSVLYRNHDADGQPIVLYGDDVLTSPQVVAIAKIDIPHRADDWTKFSLDYTYLEDIDYDLLDSNGYSFTIVGSSSIEGDIYCGAVGSQLYIDELQVLCEKIEN